ncbi:Secretory lipase [Nocardia amikacinitolerans]|uniref:Secretory lipase n=2 Tax=Nocardia amikacinitolerans TaxID=756689 RepID=A0A285LDA8_9NOCA|nr:Secretory lipase [Nocardia amikacinitolerans]SNY81391.1 Secretory lipase [Nocardia amikacinitolerans]
MWSAGIGRVARRAVLLAVVTSLGAALSFAVLPGPGPVPAGPLRELNHPSRDPATVLPTPMDDRFYLPPPGYERTEPGTLLASRVGGIGLTVTPVISTEMLIRSTDAKGRPVAVVATLLVPSSTWTGSGPRPLISFNVAIDSLGHTCAPSHQLKKGQPVDLLAAQIQLAKNYAVLVPDHQGPRQAYAAGLMAGHAVLDSVRAAVRTPRLGLHHAAPTIVTGYSGGAIASGWAAQLAPKYAPELNLVGAAFGGVPADFELLLDTMNGRNAASGVFLAATLGVAREYPEMMWLFNDHGWRLAQFAKDLCLAGLAVLGAIAPVPVELLANVPDPTETPMIQRILAENRLGAAAPRVPVFMYHGAHEVWIPLEGAENLYDDWCAQGVPVRFEVYLGEHMIVGATGIPGVNAWIDERLAGKPAPSGCSSFGLP